MILKNSLYTVIGKENILRGISYEIQINPQHYIYAAHFPKEPVTPSVCILQIVQELLDMEVGEELFMKKIKNAKFIAVISPKQLTQLWVTFTKVIIVKQEVNCQCIISSMEPEVVYAKLSFTCIKNG